MTEELTGKLTVTVTGAHSEQLARLQEELNEGVTDPMKWDYGPTEMNIALSNALPDYRVFVEDCGVVILYPKAAPWEDGKGCIDRSQMRELQFVGWYPDALSGYGVLGTLRVDFDLGVIKLGDGSPPVGKY